MVPLGWLKAQASLSVAAMPLRSTLLKSVLTSGLLSGINKGLS